MGGGTTQRKGGGYFIFGWGTGAYICAVAGQGADIKDALEKTR